MAEGNQPKFVAQEIEGGGGSGSDGRVSTAASSTGGGAYADPSHNGGGQPADSQPPATDTSSGKREPAHKGFNQSSVVFEYGGSADEDRFLTTNKALHVLQRGRPLPSTNTTSFTNNSINDDSLSNFESSLRCGFATIPEGTIADSWSRACKSQRSMLPQAGLLLLEQSTPCLPPVAPSAPCWGTDALLATGLTAAEHNPPPTSKQPHLAGPNELFFGTGERSSGVSHRDREERLRHLREKQQMERQQKLEELKEHARDWSEQAAAAQRFREQQEAQRRLRLNELRSRDQDRRSQVEERRRYMEQADQQRKEASFRKNLERDQRLETKRRNERSNIVFAFGSSTPRMLDPKENMSYWASRRATSISNVTMGAEAGSSGVNRRSSDSVDAGAGGAAGTGAPDLARKRATSAQGLDRNPNDLRMSSSMYEVFHWTDSSSSTGHSPLTPQGGDDLMSRSLVASVARRRTDLHPITPSMREAGKPRHRSPGVRSGGVTPSTPSSRPTSALSQASTTTGAVVMRTRTAPRKPRPMSIAGSAPSTADQPRSPADRESRNALRNTSSGSISSVKSSRAKSAGGSDSSGPSTPAATPAPRTPKRTPGQVKAESNAKKTEKAKASASAAARRITPKTTPVASPSGESKLLTTTASKKTTTKKIISEKPTETDSQPINLETAAQETTVQAAGSVATSVAADAETDTTNSVSIVENGVTTTTITETQEVKMESGAAEQVTTSEIITETVLSEIKNGETVVTKTVTSSIEDSSLPDAMVEEMTTESCQQPTPLMEQIDATPAAVGESQPEEAAVVEPQVENDAVVEPQIEDIAENVVTAPVQDSNNSQAGPAAPEISNDSATDGSSETAGGNGSGSASERPVTGYATEEEYKAVLAEKRRLAREAKEREIEMERKREEEEAERERREEEEMLRLMVEQREAEEKRLRMAIEQADREREEEAKRKEEEEKQRIEAEKQEAERQREAEEKLRKEEEERLSRKSRVAAIMARTRSKGGSTTPNKTESKTPSDDNKTISEVLQKANLTDSMIDKMSDSMIAAATSLESEVESCQASSGVSSEPVSDFSSQPSSDVSGQPTSDVSSQGTVENTTDSCTSGASSLEQTVRLAPTVDLLNTGLADLTLHTNGNTLLPNDGTTSQACDLLGSLNGHTNGMDNSNSQQPSVDLLGSFDPLSSEEAAFPDQNESVNTTTSQFEQIIDASQIKLSNEDAINSNPPAAPFIAFEQNLNKKSPENNTSVPDILL